MITQEELEVLTDVYISAPINPQCSGDSCSINFKAKGSEASGS